MNRRILVLLTTLFTICYCAYSQQAEPVVFTIEGNPVYKSEIESAFKKNNDLKSIGEKETIRDFIQSYIDFKLNVTQAKAQQMDTTENYKREYASSREQLIRPYLAEGEQENSYLSKIYQRMLENVEINHVLIPFDNKEIVLPSDTVSTYKKALEVREQILKNGFTSIESNSKASKTAMTIDNESQNGYMGWVVPFMLSSNVEDAVYSLPLQEVSMPVRSAKGYHIVQVLNKRAAVGGAEVEQVMFGFPLIPPTPHMIDSVKAVAEKEYKGIQDKKNFQSLCDEFSLAHKTGNQGCYFGVVGFESNLPSGFTMAALGLKEPGDVSQPVLSDYGFHIIRLIRKIPVPEFDAIKGELVSKLSKSSRSLNMSKERKEQLFGRFNITINKDAYSKLLKIAESVMPKDSAFLTHIRNADELLLDIEGKRAYTVKEFARYIKMKQDEYVRDPDELLINQFVDAYPISLSTEILDDYLQNFMFLLVTDYSNTTLELRNPQFGEIMNRVSEELLSYEVQNKNIWNRSKTDEPRLTAYFNANRQKYQLTETKYKGVIVHCKSENELQKATEISKKEKNREQLILKIRNSLNKKSTMALFEPGLWTKGDNKFVDSKIYGGEKPLPREGYPFFFVAGKLIDAPEDYTDVKKRIEADYEEKLAKDWETYLRSKYKVEIDEAVLNTIK